MDKFQIFVKLLLFINWHKLSKTQLSKIIQSGKFLGRLLGPLLKTGIPLMRDAIKPLIKSVLISLGFTATAPAAYAGIHKKFNTNNIKRWNGRH